MLRRARWQWLLAVVAVIVASCAAADGPGTGPPDPAEVPPGTEIGDDPAPDPPDPSNARPVPHDPDTEILASSGPGWHLLAVERGRAAPHLASLVTSERGLDRLWELARFRSSPPDLEFDSEVLISLTTGVSGSCPGLIFDGLVIGERVHGTFDTPPTNGACTADFNAVTFLVAADRAALPERFTLAVHEELRCAGCPTEELAVDLRAEEALEAELWGTSTLGLATAGTAPTEGTTNVVQWIGASRGALLFRAEDWSEARRWFQSFEEQPPDLVRGFVASCPGGSCPEECLGDECGGLEPVGPACELRYQPRAFVDTTFVVTFDADSCSIEAVDGIIGRGS